MTVRFIDGLILFVDGDVAMSEDCCDCGGDENCCPGVTATQVDVDFDGDNGLGGTYCAEISGAYVLEDGATPCEKVKLVPGSGSEYTQVSVVKFEATSNWAVFVEYITPFSAGGLVTRWRRVVIGCPEPGTYELDDLSLINSPGGTDPCTSNFSNGPNVVVTFV